MYNKICLSLLILIWANYSPKLMAQTQLPRMDKIPQFNCQTSVLSKLKSHIIRQGETIDSIASGYGLLPETLIKLNPILQNKPLPVGKEIKIPPFNGIRVTVPEGVTWKELAKATGVRAEILFELNGCTKIPQVVFIPGVSWYSAEVQSKNYTGLQAYPLPFQAQIGLNYGWYTVTNSSEKFFHSGVDLLASIETNVLAAGDGVVVFVGNEGSYGYLIIINHANGIQTRYAHLGRVNVKIESQVKAGDVIGQVGTTGQPDIDKPHLHFEVRYQTPQGWIAQDPMLHLPRNP